jgi:carboxymethylenebutenolidase
MCHDDNSRPPAPPEPGEVGATGPLTLTADDGNRFAAYEAVPVGPTGVGVVILPDIRGLHPYYLALAERFAEAGLAAVAMDYFGRTDGAAQRDDSFDWQSAIPKVTPDHVRADAAPCVQRLRDEHGCQVVISVGFCFGGGHSWRLASTDLDIDGSVGFYGSVKVFEGAVDEVRKPVLMLLAGADRTPPAEFLALRDRIRAAGVPAEAHVYEGAPHSFFDRTAAQWRDACADAWQRILAFASDLPR